jgi:hypothetical protein
MRVRPSPPPLALHELPLHPPASPPPPPPLVNTPPRSLSPCPPPPRPGLCSRTSPVRRPRWCCSRSRRPVSRACTPFSTSWAPAPSAPCGRRWTTGRGACVGWGPPHPLRCSPAALVVCAPAVHAPTLCAPVCVLPHACVGCAVCREPLVGLVPPTLPAPACIAPHHGREQVAVKVICKAKFLALGGNSAEMLTEAAVLVRVAPRRAVLCSLRHCAPHVM